MLNSRNIRSNPGCQTAVAGFSATPDLAVQGADHHLQIALEGLSFSGQFLAASGKSPMQGWAAPDRERWRNIPGPRPFFKLSTICPPTFLLDQDWS